MKRLYLILSICLLSIYLVGCNSTKDEVITYTVQQNEYIKEYINYSNIYIQTKFIIDCQQSRCVIQPYRCRYRTVQSILK